MFGVCSRASNASSDISAEVTRQLSCSCITLLNTVFHNIVDTRLWRSLVINARSNAPFAPIEGRLDAILRKPSRIRGLKCLKILIKSRLPDIHVHAFNSRVQQLLTEATYLDTLAYRKRASDECILSLCTSKLRDTSKLARTGSRMPR